jgi:DNA-directed RNA polymerase subunit RPC12/RpoP
MCRYAHHTYKAHFACFECRKAFKKTAIDDYVAHVGLDAAFKKIVAVFSSKSNRKKTEEKVGITYKEIEKQYLDDVSVCPECGARMSAMGLDFRPPRKSAKNSWVILHALYEHGFAFQGCGCNVGYLPPSKKSDLSAWLELHARKNEGEKLLAAILARKAK